MDIRVTEREREGQRFFICGFTSQMVTMDRVEPI